MAVKEDGVMTFTFSTALHRRKIKVDGINREIQKARYVDIDPMHIHVKEDDKIIFKALDGDLTVKNWPKEKKESGEIICEEFTVQDGDEVTKTVPKGLTGNLQLKFIINGEDPQGRPTDEDPDLIFDNDRP